MSVDLHKDTHTAVLINCWNEKLDSITIENKPSRFEKLSKRVNKKSMALGLSPIYVLETAYGYLNSYRIQVVMVVISNLDWRRIKVAVYQKW